MPVAEETVERAMRSDPRAMRALLAEEYPIVFRLAYALTGRPGAARQVLHDVLRRSLKVIPNWRRGTVAENWFYHHTIITARAAAPTPPAPRDDVLVRESPGADDPSYLAFVRALRTLPRQQSEAFILHHGEKLNTRLLGVAMDCSQNAAADHLRAAEDALRHVGGDASDQLIGAMEKAYGALVPPEGAIMPSARKYVARHVRRRYFRWAMRILLLLVLAAAAYVAWRSRDVIRSLYRDLVPASDAGTTTQPTTEPTAP